MESIRYHLELTPAQLKITHTALRSLLDDFGHDQPEILELIQEFEPASASLVLSLRFQLTDYGAKTVISTKDVSVREPMRARNSYAGVMAANEAIAKALQQMAQYVLQATEASSE